MRKISSKLQQLKINRNRIITGLLLGIILLITTACNDKKISQSKEADLFTGNRK